jgi:hypothetical protein
MVLDPGFGKRMEAMFRDDLTRSIAVDPAAFRERSMFEHFKEWGANQITRLL